MLSLTRPLRVAVLCSSRAPGLLYLLNRDPRRGTEYDVECCVTSEDTFAEQVRVERRGVPCIPHPVARFCEERGVRRCDLQARADYDRVTLSILERFHPDIVLLDGYLLLLTAPMLRAYEGRILNVHHSDLLQRSESGEVRYPGLRAVRDAFLAGEAETRASVHLVTERLDDGPVLLRSWPFPAPPVAAWAYEHQAFDVMRAAAWAHQEWMLREAWGPMLSGALAIAAMAFERPDAPLTPLLTGRWVLDAEGGLSPDREAVMA